MKTALIFLSIDIKSIRASGLTDFEVEQYAKMNLRMKLPQFKHLNPISDISADKKTKAFYVMLSEKEIKKMGTEAIKETPN